MAWPSPMQAGSRFCGNERKLAAAVPLPGDPRVKPGDDGCGGRKASGTHGRGKGNRPRALDVIQGPIGRAHSPVVRFDHEPRRSDPHFAAAAVWALDQVQGTRPGISAARIPIRHAVSLPLTSLPGLTRQSRSARASGAHNRGKGNRPDALDVIQGPIGDALFAAGRCWARPAAPAGASSQPLYGPWIKSRARGLAYRPAVSYVVDPFHSFARHCRVGELRPAAELRDTGASHETDESRETPWPSAACPIRLSTASPPAR